MINETLEANRAYQRDKDDAYNRGYKQGKADAEPHWIPCSERLPEKNGEYLCQEKLGFLYVDTWNGEYWDCAGRAYGTVIAWMPLPESYREVTE